MVLNETTFILLATCAKEQQRLYKDILDGPCHPEFYPWDYYRLCCREPCFRTSHGAAASRCSQDSAVEDSTRASCTPTGRFPGKSSARSRTDGHRFPPEHSRRRHPRDGIHYRIPLLRRQEFLRRVRLPR